MKKLLLAPCLICIALASRSQSGDSLLHLLAKAKEDTDKVKILSRLCTEYYLDKPDTAMLLAQEGLNLAVKNNFRIGEAMLLSNMGDVYLSFGNYTKAMEAQLKSLDVYEKIKAPGEAVNTLHAIALLYSDQQEPRLALSYYLKEYDALKIHPDENGLLWSLIDIAKTYANLNLPDSSQIYSDRAFEIARHYYHNNFPGYFLNTMADLYAYRGQNEQAFRYYRQSIPDLINDEYYREICQSYLGLAKLFKITGQMDSSVYYAKQALQISRDKGLLLAQLNIAGFLTTLYKSLHIIDSAFLYQELNTKIHDSLFSGSKVKEFQNILFSKQIEEREIQEVQAAYRNRIKIYVLAAVILSFLSLAIILLRSNRHKQKANSLLHKQKLEIDTQKSKIETAYQELQATQVQLIHAEKMASLGGLTAGIAHEIQNPLNFVNNFSEVNADLASELEQEIDKGNLDEAKAIARDIRENELKIGEHGKRADAIVKGMLQHSRNNTGQKELTDINALAEEYLRLSYHGIRAKDKSFNANLKTDFDNSIGKVNIIPQDMGRVLLNLYNNAFYAVNEKAKLQADNYQPQVTIRTKKIDNKVQIEVGDNGKGIPQNIAAKIFQPFFTTKPSGQGTGLGLSLSYDIVKAHNGEIKVETKEGEGSVFTIHLPLTANN
ncbi:MAG: tetratricopeptide repeat protein [Bacteroidetes bacterium]|nr:tetratricopeptide repeat protein [Bacteroidota bacterium]